MSAEEKYGPRLSLTLCYASSQDDTHPVNSLRFQQSSTTGWQSSNSANYPQELGFRFEGHVQLECIRLLAHESKISSCIDVLVADATAEESESGVCGPYKSAQFTRLGHVRFSDNQDSQHKARELKTIGIRRRCAYLKLLLRRPHMNSYNIFNQVGVVAMCAHGAMLRPFNTWLGTSMSVPVGAIVDVALSDMRPLAFQDVLAASSSQTSAANASDLLALPPPSNATCAAADSAITSLNATAQDGSDRCSEVDNTNDNNKDKVATATHPTSITTVTPISSGNTSSIPMNNAASMVERRVTELQKLKARAVSEEEYDLAEALKQQIATLQQTRTRIAELEVRKKEAVSQENYRLAKEIKQELDTLQWMTYDQPGAHTAFASVSMDRGAGNPKATIPTVSDNSETPVSAAPTTLPVTAMGKGEAVSRHASQSNGRTAAMPTAVDDARVSNVKSEHGGEGGNDTRDDAKTDDGQSGNTSGGHTRQKTTDDIPVRGKGYYDVDGLTASSVPANASSHTRSSFTRSTPHAGNKRQPSLSTTPPRGVPRWADSVAGEWERQLHVVLLELCGEEQPEPLTGPSVTEAAPFVKLFGALCCACLFGKRGQLREAGLRAISCNDGVSALHRRPPPHQGRVSADVLQYLATKSHGFADPVTGVVFVTCDIVQRIARGELGSGEPSVSQLRSEFSALVRDMVNRLADANVRVRESVMAVVHRLVHTVFGPERFIAQVYNDASAKTGANVNARVHLSHMELFDDWLDEYGVHAARPGSTGSNKSGGGSTNSLLDVPTIMEKIVLPNMQRASADVRNAAVRLFAKLVHMEPRASTVFMPQLKPAQQLAVEQQLTALREKAQPGARRSETDAAGSAATAAAVAADHATNAAKPSTGVAVNNRRESSSVQPPSRGGAAGFSAPMHAADDKKTVTAKNNSRSDGTAQTDKGAPSQKRALTRRNLSTSSLSSQASSSAARASSAVKKSVKHNSHVKHNHVNSRSISSHAPQSSSSCSSSSSSSSSILDPRLRRQSPQSERPSSTAASTAPSTRMGEPAAPDKRERGQPQGQPPPPTQGQTPKLVKELSRREGGASAVDSSITTAASTRAGSAAEDNTATAATTPLSTRSAATVATSVSEMTSVDRVSSASLGLSSPAAHEMERRIEQTCQFCGEYDPTFDEANLDEHYVDACPMLCPCPLCDQVTEISTLQQHLVEECEGRNLVRQCPRCQEAVQAEDLAAHIQAKTCIETDSSHSVCPLCHSRFANSMSAWRKHLASAPGCVNNPRRYDGSGPI